MLDLETLGNDCIVQIGACYFDWEGNIGDKFLVNISLASALKYGQVELGELKFWLDNKNKISWLKEGKDLPVAIQRLREFIKKKSYIWSHYYDIMVLENVCKNLNQKLPFNHKNWRDIRTLVALSGYKRQRKIVSKCCEAGVSIEGDKDLGEIATQYYVCNKCKSPCDVIRQDPKTHNALDDCIYQVQYVIEAYKLLKNQKE